MGETAASALDGLPNIEEFAIQVEVAQQTIDDRQLSLQALEGQIAIVKRDLSSLVFHRDNKVKSWLEAVPSQHPLYSASYFLGSEPRDTVEQIKFLHERGTWFCKLAEICGLVPPQPVLVLDERSAAIIQRAGKDTTRVRGQNKTIQHSVLPSVRQRQNP